MTRQTRIIFFTLIALVGLLAASTSFFYAKTRKLQGAKQTSSPRISSKTDIKNGESTPSPAISTQVTKAAAGSEKPSKPTDTYTVQRGETLFAVAQANGTTWTVLSEANGIEDVDKIQAGQVVIIPKGNTVFFTIDNTRATEIQKSVDGGKYSFRKDPIETARSDAPTIYSLQITDEYSQKSKDLNQGTATVQAIHESKKYLIKLVQPVTKGENGIWAIEAIESI